MVEGGNIKGRKKVEEKVKFTITKKKSCWLCVCRRSCGLQQLILITTQNNPLFVHRNRIVAFKKSTSSSYIISLFQHL